MDTTKRLPTHPGDVLKEEIESRGITQKQFSELLINMQNRYNMAVARRKPTLVNRLTAIRKACAAVFV